MAAVHKKKHRGTVSKSSEHFTLSLSAAVTLTTKSPIFASSTKSALNADGTNLGELSLTLITLTSTRASAGVELLPNSAA